MRANQRYAFFIFLLGCFFLTGCMHLPVEVTPAYGTPANKYDYLLAVFYSFNIAEQETSSVKKNSYQQQANQCYDVWKRSWIYKFDGYPWDLTQAQKTRYDVYRDKERLKRFYLYLETNQYPSYRDDINQAVQELSTQIKEGEKVLESLGEHPPN